MPMSREELAARRRRGQAMTPEERRTRAEAIVVLRRGGKTYDAIAEAFDLSRARVNQIVHEEGYRARRVEAYRQHDVHRAAGDGVMLRHVWVPDPQNPEWSAICTVCGADTYYPWADE
jgi:uncharacterized protein (DUF433 family)